MLAALSVAALLALPAAASASGGFAADGYSATVHGVGGTLKLEASGTTLECTAPTFNATLNGPAHTLATGAKGKYTCTNGGGTVNMNGCEFIFHSGSEAEIGPPGCGPVVFPASCAIWINSKTGLSATYSGAEVREGIKLAEGAVVSGTVTFANGCAGSSGTLTASWGLSATAAEKETNRYVGSTYVPVGIALSEATPPLLKSQAFSVAVAAIQNGTLSPFEVSGLEMACTKTNLSGGEWAKEATAAFALGGTYGSASLPAKCPSHIGNIKVSMNSCKYNLPEVEWLLGSSYTVKNAAIACGTEGDAIVLSNTGTGCEIRISPQPLLASLSSNHLTPTGAGIGVAITGSKMKYTLNKGCEEVGVKGSGEDGVMNQELFMAGQLPG